MTIMELLLIYFVANTLIQIFGNHTDTCSRVCHDPIGYGTTQDITNK